MNYLGGYFTNSKSDLLSFVRVLHLLSPFSPQLYWFSFVLVYYSNSYSLGTLIEANHATIVEMYLTFKEADLGSEVATKSI